MSPQGFTVKKNHPPGAALPKPRRVRPALIAPLIPTWGLIAFVGVQQLGGTRWFIPFLAVMAATFLLLFGFVTRQLIAARRLRQATRDLAK